MSTERLVLSEKYKAFLRCDAPVEFLEGTTAAGKTTVGLFKFMCKVAESPKKLHILAADDTGTAEKNIINKDLGILDDFGILAEYKGNGSGEYKMPHILFHTSSGDKIIFVIGYGNKSKWKDALGGQYGCLYIDEVNTANIDFVREASMRCDYLIATLKGYIKKRIVSLFDATGEIAKLSGDFSVALADIFDVFSGDDAKAITADIIQVFADGFLGAADLAVKFKRDFVSLFTVPVIQNTDKISETLENMLGRWRVTFDALSQSFTDTFDKINSVYDQYFKPFVDSITQGISDILGTFLEAYNTYLSPYLDYISDKFSSVWKEHVQPALDGILELLGKVFENLKALWETALVPCIEWIVNNVMPVLGPIIGGLGELILDLLAVAGDVIKGITDILGGFIDFCTGVFTNDFSKCWQGIEEILQGFKTIATSIFDFAKKYIFQPFIDYVKGIFRTDWSQSFGLLGTVLNTFLESVKRIWGDAKTIFNGIITFIKGTFHGNWKQAWSGIKDIFKGIFDSLVTLAKTPLNAVIDIINNLMHKLNSGLSAIENAFSFSYDFTNPITGTRHYGHYGMSLPRVPTIPHLANGGYVKPNTPQLAMIGDNLHQGEVVAPEDKLKKMAIEAALAAGGTGVSKAELESIINRAVMRIVAALTDMGFYLDSTQIAKATQEAKAAMDIRYNSVEVK